MIDANVAKEAEELNEEDMKIAEPLIPVFGMELMKKVLSSDWHHRELAVNQIVDEITLGSKSLICG